MVGRLDVDNLMAETPGWVFDDWASFHRMSPPLEIRLDVQTGYLLQAILNAIAGNKLSLADCIPEYGKETPEMDWGAMINMCKERYG